MLSIKTRVVSCAPFDRCHMSTDVFFKGQDGDEPGEFEFDDELYIVS